MANENTGSSDFDPRSSIVKSVFDCRLPGVIEGLFSRNYNPCENFRIKSK